MPKLDKQFILKGPCPIELEAELQHLTSDEKAVIYVVMQKDLKFKEAMTNKKEDKEILDDWGKRVSNLTAPILVPPKGKKRRLILSGSLHYESYQNLFAGLRSICEYSSTKFN